jgi:hypothetical protein
MELEIQGFGLAAGAGRHTGEQRLHAATSAAGGHAADGFGPARASPREPASSTAPSHELCRTFARAHSRKPLAREGEAWAAARPARHRHQPVGHNLAGEERRANGARKGSAGGDITWGGVGGGERTSGSGG